MRKQEPIRITTRTGNWCELWNADCLDLLPIAADAVITDPPYGIGRDGHKKTTGVNGGRKAYEFRGWDKERPKSEAFKAILSCGRQHVIWGGQYFADLLPPKGGWLVWDKGQRIDQSDGELAWSSNEGALRIFEKNRVQLMIDGPEHPTQKPVCLMAWSMEMVQVQVGATVLDPYMGSGTTGIACIRTGRNFIGIEKDPRHFQTAVDRIRREAEAMLL